jgi:hypothetical protein
LDVGYDAAVVEQVERRGQLKRYLGHPLFAYAALDTWIRRYDRKKPAFRVEFGHSHVDGFFAVCLNTDPYTYLGSRPLSLVPEASLERPLGTMVLKSLGLRPTMRAMVAAFRGGGRLAKVPTADVRHDLHSLRVVGYRPFPWQVDGDHLGDAEVLNFRWEPDVINLVLP